MGINPSNWENWNLRETLYQASASKTPVLGVALIGHEVASANLTSRKRTRQAKSHLATILIATFLTCLFRDVSAKLIAIAFVALFFFGFQRAKAERKTTTMAAIAPLLEGAIQSGSMPWEDSMSRASSSAQETNDKKDLRLTRLTRCPLITSIPQLRRY